MDIKKEVFQKLDKVMKPGSILASNTSYLDLDEIAAATSRPADVIGLHFFSPANIMKLLEVVRGKETCDEVLMTAMKLARSIGKVAVVARVCHGFIGNRMLAVRRQQAESLILEGAKYWDVDAALLEFGFPMGHFQMTDLAGVDIGWHRDPTRVETVREALCAQERLGQKVGRGFYDYDNERQRTPSDEVQAIIEQFARQGGRKQRSFEADEIRERLLYPMIDEAAKILEENIAQRASDIDVVWINGYGWPLWTGGPMYWAHTEGYANIVTSLERFGLAPGDAIRRLASQ